MPPVNGYVLAGGRSSRMGTNKALLPLGGKPLIERAVTKLTRLCAGVRILSSDEALAPYGPLVRDIHLDCGPMSGIEAALRNTDRDWNLILPVDVPFLTTDFLDQWLWAALHRPAPPIRIAMMFTDATPQPTILIVHRDVAPYLTGAIEAGNYKLFPALRMAALSLAELHGKKPREIFWESQWDEVRAPEWQGIAESWRSFRRPARAPADFDRFMNVNTPEEFAAAERLLSLLEP